MFAFLKYFLNSNFRNLTFQAKNFEPFWGIKRRRSSIYEPSNEASTSFASAKPKPEVIVTCDDVISVVEESLKNELEEGEPCAKKSRSADGEDVIDFADQTPISMEVEVADMQMSKEEKFGESKNKIYCISTN